MPKHYLVTVWWDWDSGDLDIESVKRGEEDMREGRVTPWRGVDIETPKCTVCKGSRRVTPDVPEGVEILHMACQRCPKCSGGTD